MTAYHQAGKCGDFPMVRAVLKNGDIQPLEPIPSNWVEGQRLQIDVAVQPSADEPDIEKWYAELRRLAALVPASDHERMEQAIDEQDRQAKEQARRDMGV